MSNNHDSLTTYRRRRDFRRTGEPSGDDPPPANDEPVFVIQQHDASTLHYDFRLEVDGVLKSWAVPKGPSMDPRERRLAIATEDHPLAYANFEGTIPAGEYGAGTVQLWDRGSYHNRSTDSDGNPVAMERALAAGKVTVELHGTKLNGGWALVHMEDVRDNNQWLLIKVDDETADARRNPTSTQMESVASGRVIEEMRQQDS